MKVLVDVGLKSVAQPAVHSNQCPGHPLPLLPTQVPGPQGGGLRVTKDEVPSAL